MEQQVICGNCLELMTPELGLFDVIVTSPPYNLDIDYNTYKDNKERKEYIEWMAAVFMKAKDLLTPNGSMFINLGFGQPDLLLPLEVAKRLSEFMVLQNQIAWVKSIRIGDEQKGSFTPNNSEKYLSNNFEYVFHFTKSYQKIDKNNMSNCWFFPYTYLKSSNMPLTGLNFKPTEKEWLTLTEAHLETGINISAMSVAADKGWLKSNGERSKKRRIYGPDFNRWAAERTQKKTLDHPAMFPVELAEMCLKVHGCGVGCRMLDPFVGVGSSLLAAKNLGLDAVGIDIDPKYVAEARERLVADYGAWNEAK